MSAQKLNFGPLMDGLLQMGALTPRQAFLLEVSARTQRLDEFPPEMLEVLDLLTLAKMTDPEEGQLQKSKPLPGESRSSRHRAIGPCPEWTRTKRPHSTPLTRRPRICR